MDGAPSSDKSLLERLNALKPSSVSLISPSSSNRSPSKPEYFRGLAKYLVSNPTPSIDTIERARPPSGEDALTARLKSLRSQAAESIDSVVTDWGRGVGESTLPRPAKRTRSPAGDRLGIQQVSTFQVTDDVDPLLYTDDQTLEELLEDLRSDETWLDEVAAEEEEHQRITALLAELGTSSSVSAVPDKQTAGRDSPHEDSEDSDDDDSEGEILTAEVDSVLGKAMDEVEWEMVNKAPSPPPQLASTPPEDAKQASQDGIIQSSNDSPFTLPTVPSELQDQPNLPTLSTQPQSDVDFAASIASRMSALKLSAPRSLPSAPTAAVDSLGLPQAPTFAPADHPVPGLAKRTDEDQKSWCVVCLEDGTIRCLGCEDGDNVYCARCWKEMHVGPRAGYDERGHSWETFSSRPR